MLYQVHLLKDTRRPGVAGLLGEINAVIAPGVSQQGGSVYGVFPGLFGLSSNEVYLVTTHESGLSLELPGGVELAQSRRFKPTVRPTSHTPRETPGIYVFRWFSVAPGNVDDIVALSAAAWPTFEANFDTSVQGLFVEDEKAPGSMLLLTWYRDLSVWEASRQPPEEARDNFLKRHQLTLGAKPIATQLAMPEATPLVSHT